MSILTDKPNPCSTPEGIIVSIAISKITESPKSVDTVTTDIDDEPTEVIFVAPVVPDPLDIVSGVLLPNGEGLLRQVMRVRDEFFDRTNGDVLDWPLAVECLD